MIEGNISTKVFRLRFILSSVQIFSLLHVISINTETDEDFFFVFNKFFFILLTTESECFMGCN